MGSRKELAEDVPWRGRSKGKPLPKISQKPLLTVRQTPNFNYAVSIMKHPDPIGKGLATEAFLESAGPECIVPGQVRPLKLLGLQVVLAKLILHGFAKNNVSPHISAVNLSLPMNLSFRVTAVEGWVSDHNNNLICGKPRATIDTGLDERVWWTNHNRASESTTTTFSMLDEVMTIIGLDESNHSDSHTCSQVQNLRHVSRDANSTTGLDETCISYRLQHLFLTFCLKPKMHFAFCMHFLPFLVS
eukprot:Gb_17386 [translate_table: standard]